MMIFSLVAMIGLKKCCITSACLQWLCHSGERIVAHGPLVFIYPLPQVPPLPFSVVSSEKNDQSVFPPKGTIMVTHHDSALLNKMATSAEN